MTLILGIDKALKMRRSVKTTALVRANIDEIERRLASGLTIFGACEWLSKHLDIAPPLRFHTFRNALQQARKLGRREDERRPAAQNELQPRCQKNASTQTKPSRHRRGNPIGEILEMKTKGEI